MNTLLDFLAVFVHSDVAGPSPAWWHWINAFATHVMIGAMFAKFAPRLWWSLFGFWVAKEILGDIPNGGWSGLIIADSLADLVAGCIGYWALRANTLNLSKQTLLKPKN